MKVKFNDILIGNNTLLKGGELQIKENGINLIKGKNGCGKTLLLKSIMKNNKRFNLAMVLLDQDNEITPICDDIVKSIALNEEVEKREKIIKQIKKIGCDFLFELKWPELSGGEQRLINVLRCMCSEADVLLMDEPTNDLDYNMVEKVLGLMIELKQEKTIIVVSHDDRVDEIADQVFEIKEEKLVVKKESILEKEKEKNSNGIKVSTTFINNCFKYNVVNGICIIILFLIVLLQVDSFKRTMNCEMGQIDIPENQMFLCSIYSDSIEYCGTNSVLPAFVVDTSDIMNPMTMVRLADDVKNFYNLSNVELYNLKLKSNADYKVYPLEYISEDGREHINVLQYYREKLYGDLEDVYIDTSKYFFNIYDDVSEYKNCYALDVEQYNQCIEELEKDEDLIVGTEVVVLKDGYTSSEFWEKEEIKKLIEHKVCIYSKEVSEFIYQLSIINQIWGSVRVMFISALILLIINYMYIRLQMLSVKKCVFLFKNYAVDCNRMIGCVVNRINDKRPGLFLFVLFFIILIIKMKTLPVLQINFIFVVCPMLYCSVMYKLENLIIEKSINKYYRWDAR